MKPNGAWFWSGSTLTVIVETMKSCLRGRLADHELERVGPGRIAERGPRARNEVTNPGLGVALL